MFIKLPQIKFTELNNVLTRQDNIHGDLPSRNIKILKDETYKSCCD